MRKNTFLQIDYKDTGYIRTGTPTCRNTSELLANSGGDDVIHGAEEANSNSRQSDSSTHIAAASVAAAASDDDDDAAAWEDSCPPCDNCPPCPVASRAKPPQTCSWTHPEDSWGLVTCMDNMKLGGTAMKGNGRDAFWPPSAKTRDWTLEDEIGVDNLTAAHCGKTLNSIMVSECSIRETAAK